MQQRQCISLPCQVIRALTIVSQSTMPKQFSRSLAQLSTLSILTMALMASGAEMASAGPNSNNRTGVYPTEPKGDAIDSYTDHFFYAANPELNKRKLRSDDTAYAQEWQALREAIAPLVKTNREACGRSVGSADLYWEFDLSAPQNASSYDYLADAIFYHRNPDLAGQKLRPNTAAAREWSAIRSKMFIYVCGL
jgi:hypothetical protein